eukprot:280002_1
MHSSGIGMTAAVASGLNLREVASLFFTVVAVPQRECCYHSNAQSRKRCTSLLEGDGSTVLLQTFVDLHHLCRISVEIEELIALPINAVIFVASNGTGVFAPREVAEALEGRGVGAVLSVEASEALASLVPAIGFDEGEGSRLHSLSVVVAKAEEEADLLESIVCSRKLAELQSGVRGHIESEHLLDDILSLREDLAEECLKLEEEERAADAESERLTDELQCLGTIIDGLHNLKDEIEVHSLRVDERALQYSEVSSLLQARRVCLASDLRLIYPIGQRSSEDGGETYTICSLEVPEDLLSGDDEDKIAGGRACPLFRKGVSQEQFTKGVNLLIQVMEQLAVSSGATSEDDLCSKTFPCDTGSAVFWYLDLIMRHCYQEVEALN